jgi:hypothetical protein
MGKEQSKVAYRELDCSRRELETLVPENLASGNAEHIEVLILSSNKLCDLSSIGAFSGLKQLDASRNLIKVFDVTHVPHLTSLDLSFNQLDSLPQSIGVLTTLLELKLSNNKINSISREIGFLDGLSYLDLSHNNISELPEEFSNLAALQSLYLNNNQLTTQGCIFGGLFSLKTVDLSNNQLTQIPDLTFLPSLCKLYLNNNRLTEISEGIFMVPKLRELSLRGNKLRTLPKDFNKLCSLTLLDLEDNPLPDIEVFNSNDVNLINTYLVAPVSEKRKIVADVKQNARTKKSQPSQGVHISLKEAGVKKEISSSEPIPINKRLFCVTGDAEETVVFRVNVSYQSLNQGDCFVFDSGSKYFVWHGADSNSYERAKAEWFANILAFETSSTTPIILDSGLFEDSPLLPEGLDFWDRLGGKGIIQTGIDVERDVDPRYLYFSKLKLFSVVENDANRQCDVDILFQGYLFSKDLLNSSHCYVLDCWSQIFVWAGAESSGNEKSYALLKSEELEAEALQGSRPSCVTTSWIVDGDELCFFKEHFFDWRDNSWTTQVRHQHIKVLEANDSSEYDKVCGIHIYFYLLVLSFLLTLV